MVVLDDIKRWLEVKGRLDSDKKEEQSLRKAITADFLPKNTAGSITIGVGLYKVKGSITERLDINRDDLLASMEALSDADKECISWKPTIDKRAYDKLPADSHLRTLTTLKLNTAVLSVTGG